MNNTMTGLDIGYYIAELNETATQEEGVHPVTYTCECPGKTVGSPSTYEVVPSRLLSYITNSTSPLYSNMWGYTSRTLSIDGLISIAQAVWNSTITGLRQVDIVPILQTVEGRYGPETKTIPSNEIDNTLRQRWS
jgi:hypothetical protein